ncbi:hypothetical protein [Nostoc sp. FACHB-133]|uniref:hypothetical protein n=1 Tax=Nostoc sp. FACHB-133 TaxID=2692835 RepID=UPI0016846B8A|nr:hypothetical protein [Nostoc sp. FACHB-133]MBD2527904.1 hypothetical protein [Nostoc sp. FACHB-133]
MMKISYSQTNTKVSPFEDWLDLTTFVKLKRGGYSIGAYLLSKKLLSDTNNTLQLVFGWEQCGFVRSSKKQAIAKIKSK